MTKPSVSIASITFSGGQTIELKPKDKVLLVGPNNSGKSITLKEILEEIVNYDKIDPKNPKYSNNNSIKGISLRVSGTIRELENFLKNNYKFVNDEYVYSASRISKEQLKDLENKCLCRALISGYIKNIGAEDRLSTTRMGFISRQNQKTIPQHFLYDDENLMNRISELFRTTFNKDLFFNFRGGGNLPIHVGEKPIIEHGEDRVSNSYVAKVREHPLLHKQGDGMRSYAGLLFETLTTEQDVTLIDEPEAFLHPPQMKKLGETLSNEVAEQLVVATHSSDIMRGFLTGTSGSVRILRIHRDGNMNKVTEAPGDSIKRLWEEPVLRYSNALEGIFHELVVVCEDDSDCRLFNAVADAMAKSSGDVWKDTAYVPAGGKHGIPRIAEVLRGTGVPTVAVFDIDFLSERDLVKKTVEAFGGDWVDFEPLWSRIDAAVRDGIPPMKIEDGKASVREVLDSSNSDDVDRLRKDINDQLKSGKPWSQVKESGTHAIPKGEAQGHFEKLNEALRNLGIFVVPVGEVESFDRKIGKHGSKFVNEMLRQKNLSSDPELTGLRKFVEEIHHAGTIDSVGRLRTA